MTTAKSIITAEEAVIYYNACLGERVELVLKNYAKEIVGEARIRMNFSVSYSTPPPYEKDLFLALLKRRIQEHGYVVDDATTFDDVDSDDIDCKTNMTRVSFSIPTTLKNLSPLPSQ